MSTEHYNVTWLKGCRMEASKHGVWWGHSHADTVRCPLQPWRLPAIHWRAAR